MKARSHRIIGNTLALYMRQALILLVSLYTVRVLLLELGIEDYGIFSAVGGLVAIGSFLSGSLAQATQRFFSFALGSEDSCLLKRVFSVNLALYGVVALCAFGGLFSLGAYFVKSHMVFPMGKVSAGTTLYYYSALTFIVSIVTSPFVAIMIAHEDMKIYAYFSVVEASVKLAIVISLQFIASDKLELYGALLLCAALVNMAMYASFCLLRYDECQVRRIYWDGLLLREIVGFTGWTVFGQMSTAARTHAVTVLLNQSFNPGVVAARAISVQITTALNAFTGSFSTALYPPIIKSYSSSNSRQMFRLVNAGARLTFFLLWVFALPLIFEMEAVLSIWLEDAPSETALFARLALVESLIFSLSMPLTAAARAPGKMRIYEVVLGSMQFGILLLAWLVVRQGAPAYGVFIVGIIMNALMFVARLFLVRMLTGLSILSFLREAVVPTLYIILFSISPLLLAKWALPAGLSSSAILVFLSVIFSSWAMYIFGLDANWRAKIKSMVFGRLSAGGGG